jgi:ferric-dicitrate binding protein FerR (iron transport regulator)
VEEIIDILQKKLNGNVLSKKEQNRFDAWFSVPENKAIYNDYKKIWNITEDIPQVLTPDVDAQWDKFKNNINISTSKKSNTIKLFITKYSAAAAIIVLLSLVFALKYFSGSNKVFHSANAVLKVTLADNSVVTLNKNSSLYVSKYFNKKSRTVTLKGEALFNVKRDSKHPFIVKTDDNVNVKVLGTVFNVRAYKNCPNIELKVVSGKVLFEKNKNRIIVSKGEEAKYIKNNNNFEKVKPLDINSLAWNTHHLKFNNSPINEVADALERYLNKNIILPENIGNMRYTGEFTNPSEKDIVEILSLAMGWNYKITKTSIIFTIK